MASLSRSVQKYPHSWDLLCAGLISQSPDLFHEDVADGLAFPGTSLVRNHHRNVCSEVLRATFGKVAGLRDATMSANYLPA